MSDAHFTAGAQNKELSSKFTQSLIQKFNTQAL